MLVIGTSRAAEDAAAALRAESWTVVIADGLSTAEEAIQSRRHALLLVDADAVTEPPWRVVELVRELDPQAAPLLLVTPNTPWASYASYHQRPAGLVLKPVDGTSLLMAVDSALVYRRLLEENRRLKRQLGSAESLADWVGSTKQSSEVRKSIATAALTTGNVLLVGERGTGRRLAAELLHRHGRHPATTLVPVDLTSLPAGELRRLFQEALDATYSGAGSYAQGARPGALYLAELTALGEGDRAELGELLARPLPFRVIASASPRLLEEVQAGRFDAEAFGAVSKITIGIPALRERRGDIPLLIDHFLKRFCARFELRRLGIPPRAIERYASYDWPGNVAELAMLIERAVSIASAAKFEGTTLPEPFCAPPSLVCPESSPLENVSLRELIADIEKRIILQTLERVDGSQKRAAEELKLNPTTLHEKMKRYKLLRRQRA